MPPRVRLLLMVALAAVSHAASAAAQEGREPSSSYRLRSDHGQNKLLEVPSPQEERTGAATAPASEGERPRTTELPSPSPTSSRPRTSTSTASSPLKLAPRSQTGGRQLAKPAATSATGAVGSVVGSLAAVLGLFVFVVW